MSTIGRTHAAEVTSLEKLKQQGEDLAARGDLAAALHYLEHAIDLARTVEEDSILSEILGAYGDVQCELGNFDDAIDAFKQALRLDETHKDELGTVSMQRRLGTAYQEKGDAARAKEAYREAEQLLRRLDPGPENDRQHVLLLISQASFDAERARFRNAQEKLQEALAASEAASDIASQIACLRRLAGVASEASDFGGAKDYLDRAEELLDRQPEDERDLPELIEVQLLRGAVFEEQGSVGLALDRYRQAHRLAESLRLTPAQAESLRRIGSAYKARGDWAPAIERYEQAIALCKELADDAALSQLHGDLGDVYAEQGSIDEAIRQYKNSLDLDQRHQDTLGMAVAQRRLGSAYQEKGEFARAEDAYDEADRLLEDSEDEDEKAQLHICRGSLRAEQGHLIQALESYDKALEIYRSHDDMQGQATCLRHMGAARKQLGQLTGAEKDLTSALDILREQGEDKPEMIEAMNLLGAVFEDAGRTADALALYRDALRLAEEIKSRPLRAESLRRMGSAFAVQGDFGAAIERYRQAIDIAKQIEDEVALSQLHGDVGDIYLEQGNVRDAIDEFKEALRLDSAHSDELGIAIGNRRLGSAYHRRGEHARARECYEDANRLLERLDNAGERAVLGVQWGMLYEDQGQYRAALEHYRQALAINTDQANDIGVAICERHTGSALFKLGDLDAAEERLEHALDLLDRHGGEDKPELIAIKTALVAVRLEQRRIADARALATQAHREAESIQNRPAIAEGLRARGAVHQAEGSYEPAIERLSEALEIAKELTDEVLCAEILDDLADAYECNGQLEVALKAYRDGLSRARRLDRHALTADILLGVARCHRELGRHDVARESIDEAAVAIERHDASAQAKALLALERGQLAEAEGREDSAVDEYDRGLEFLLSSGDALRIDRCRRLLLAAHARRGDLSKAAEHLAALLNETSPGELWSAVALPRLNQAIALATDGPMAAGRYGHAVKEAFDVVGRGLIAVAPDTGGGRDAAAAAAAWFDPDRRGIAPFRDQSDLQSFAQLTVGALEAHRAHLASDDEASDATDSFAWIAVAHLIMRYLHPPNAGAPAIVGETRLGSE